MGKIDWGKYPNFSKDEFIDDSGDWSEKIEESTLAALQALRTAIGDKVVISPVPGALGRMAGSRTSMHYCGPGSSGTFCAADFFCKIDGRYIHLEDEIAKVVMMMHKAGFNGVGVYNGLYAGKPATRYHGDTRHLPVGHLPATWHGDRSLEIKR